MALFMLEAPAKHYQIRTNPPILTNICRTVPPEKISNGFDKGEGATVTPL